MSTFERQARSSERLSVLLLVGTLILSPTVTAEGLHSEPGSMTAPEPKDGGRHCFPENERTNERTLEVLEWFINSANTSGRGAEALLGSMQLQARDFALLDDAVDAQICRKFNAIYRDAIVSRQVDSRPGADEFLDPEAYTYDVAYYKAASLYFAVFRTARLEAKDPDSLFVSTGGSALIEVYDRNLNRLGLFDSFGSRLD